MYLTDHAKKSAFAHQIHVVGLPSTSLTHDLGAAHYWLL
jgi:hypothetical protein